MFGIPAAVAITKMWFSHKEKMAGLGGPKQGTAMLDARLARVEQAVESIAIEMERVSEGQRFVTKILTDRPQIAGAAAAGAGGKRRAECRERWRCESCD